MKPFNRALKNRSSKSVLCTNSFYIKTPVSNKAPSTRIRFYLKTNIFSPWLPSNFLPRDGLSKPFRFAHLYVSTSVSKQIFFSGLQQMLPRYKLLEQSFFDARACTTKYKISGWPTNSFYLSLDVLPGIILGIIISWDNPHPPPLRTLPINLLFVCWINQLIVVCLVPYPLNKRQAKVDIALIQTSSLFSWKLW